MKFNFFSKTSFIGKILFILILFLTIIFINKLDLVKKENFIDKREKFTKYYGNDIYDEFYVSIYDTLMYDEVKNTYEVQEIINLKTPNNVKRLLDIGSGTGHHVNLLSNNNSNQVIGIDISPSMINKAKLNYPEMKFKQGNALDNMLFQDNEFTHITCLNMTIYSIKDKEQFFENCFKWLSPGGVLVINLVDIRNFNPILPSADVVALMSSQINNNSRVTESNIEFKDFTYKSNFELKEENYSSKKLNKANGFFTEKIVFNNNNSNNINEYVRINEHQYYMNTQKAILSIAKDVGFIYQGYSKLDNVNYKNNYLYWLYKPE